MRIQTMALKPGDVVLTNSVSPILGYVKSAGPGAGGTWRTVEDIAVQPVDRKADPDRVIFFTDGAKAASQHSHYWTIKEVTR